MISPNDFLRYPVGVYSKLIGNVERKRLHDYYVEVCRINRTNASKCAMARLGAIYLINNAQNKLTPENQRIINYHNGWIRGFDGELSLMFGLNASPVNPGPGMNMKTYFGVSFWTKVANAHPEKREHIIKTLKQMMSSPDTYEQAIGVLGTADANTVGLDRNTKQVNNGFISGLANEIWHRAMPTQ